MNLSEYQNYHETKSHTASEFPYNTYLCSIPLDFTLVPLHWHAELEIVVIKKGTGLISVDFEKRTVSSVILYLSARASFTRLNRMEPGKWSTKISS